MKFFNTAGPNKPELNYTLPPLGRLNLPEVLELIEAQRYFVMHAPRQTGKTSCLLTLQDELNQSGRYACVYCNVELGQGAREDVDAALHAIIGAIARRVEMVLGETYLLEQQEAIRRQAGEHGVLNALLTAWAKHSAKPIVFLMDEIPLNRDMSLRRKVRRTCLVNGC